MVIGDPLVQRWLANGATVLRYVVPITVGVAITGLGRWLGRGHRHAHVAENL